jgi:hypothetical protein
MRKLRPYHMPQRDHGLETYLLQSAVLHRDTCKPARYRRCHHRHTNCGGRYSEWWLSGDHGLRAEDFRTKSTNKMGYDTRNLGNVILDPNSGAPDVLIDITSRS